MKTVNISLPDELIETLEQKRQQAGFDSRAKFIQEILKRELKQDQVAFMPFIKQPIEKIALELTLTGKYSEKFIKSLLSGLKKSSMYADRH